MGGMGRTFAVLPDDMRQVLQAGGPGSSFLSSKLAATLGPSSRDVETIKGMLLAGMKLARLDFSFATPEYHQETLNNLRAAMAATELPCAVVMTMRGRTVFVLTRPNNPITLSAGSRVTLACNTSAPASASLLPVSTISSFDGLSVGDTVFVGQALFMNETQSASLTVESVNGTSATCIINRDATLDALQLTVHLPEVSEPGPPLSSEDITALHTFGAANDIDFVSVPLTKCAQDVAAVRAALADAGLPNTKVIAKIECISAVKAHKSIIDAADAIVLARGNLGTVLSAEKVFVVQKLLLRAANIGGKPVFVSRVVDSMTDAPRPTRAEATDVANLVLDGADGILLGGETFRGGYPIDAVQFISAICRSAEQCFSPSSFYQMQMELLGSYTLTPDMSTHEALASSAVRAADKMQARLIIAFTVTGNTARMLAKYKPAQPILTVVCPTASSAQFVPSQRLSGSSGGGGGLTKVKSVAAFKSEIADTKASSAVARQCLSMYGVIPILADPDLEVDEQLQRSIDVAKAMGLVTTGDRIVVSQCPRKGKFDLMDEAGVVILQEVE